MVWRIVWYSLLLIAVALGIVWLADHPGQVAVRWLSWRFETSVPMLFGAMLVLVAIVYFLLRVIRILLTLPSRWRNWRESRRQNKGIKALTGSLTALAAGDDKKAKAYAERTENLLDNHGLSLLLTTQAAEMSGDVETVRKNYTEMLKQPETEFAAVRGLLMQAVKDGDDEAALKYAQRALTLNPQAVRLYPLLLDLHMRARQWEQALKDLARIKRYALMTQQEMEKKRAFILNEQAALQEAEFPEQALRLARQSHEADPDFMPALARMTRVALKLGKGGKVVSVLEAAWMRAPNEDIARLYASLFAKDDQLVQVRHAEKLVKMRPEAPAGHALLGEAAMKAKLWGQARTHLTKAFESTPILRYCMLLVRLEDAEGNAEGVRKWLEKAELLTTEA